MDAEAKQHESMNTAARPPIRPGVLVKTFGCQMNEYDSEKMLAGLSRSHRKVSELHDAEVVLINTCSVREKAEHKLYSLLGELSELKAARPELIIGVAGCVAQQEGQKIIRRSKAVNFVVGTHNISLVPSLVSAARDGRAPQVAIDYREEWEDLPQDFEPLSLESSDFASAYSSPVRALVSIQRGCSKNCSYCVVPTTRGIEVSRAKEEILKEVRLKVRLGAKEVLLLGQTVNSYGKDLEPRVKFEELIEELSEIEGLKRIRFTSPHPAEVRESFIELYGRIPALCPHIHLPLQSGSNRILKLMNRNYKRERYLEIVRALKERVPSIKITTDIIVGFPTENEEDFLETLSLMEEVQYQQTFSFVYSRRPNTEAIKDFSLEQEVARDVASRRLQELQALQDNLSTKINASMVGEVKEVLVEAPTKNSAKNKGNNGVGGGMRGRTGENILVEIEGCSDGAKDLKIGDLVNVKVEKAGPYCLRGNAICE